MQMSEKPKNPLFRIEAVKAKSTSGLGRIRLDQSVSYATVSLIALGISIAIVSFATLSSYTKKAHVAGITVPRGGLILVTAVAPGRVKNLLVTEGQHVKSGEKIIEIASERETGNGEASELVGRQLSARFGSLDNEEQILTVQRNDRDASLSEQMRNIDRQIEEVKHEISIAKRKLTLTNISVENYQKLLQEGYMPTLLVKQKQEESLDGEARISSLERAQIDLQANYSSIKFQRHSLSNSLISDLLQVKKSRAALRQEIIENDSRKSNYLAAPTESIVSTISVQTGQSVAQNQSMVTLIPFDANEKCRINVYNRLDIDKCKAYSPTVMVQLFAPSRTAGFIMKGQQVLIRFDAFPYQKFGLQHGIVIDISRTPLSSAELPSTLAAGLLARTHSLTGLDGEALFRINVELRNQDISLYGKSHFFKPGLMLEADVLLDRRKVWEWLLEPALAMEADN